MARLPAIIKWYHILLIIYSLTLTIMLMSFLSGPSSCLQEINPSNPKFDKKTLPVIRTYSHENNQSMSGEWSSSNGMMHVEDGDNLLWGKHKLAVIVPFRDRFEELLDFAPHLHQFLNKQKIRHKIFVINQIDSLRFNRGSLINVGFQESGPECDYIAMHDVDLLPLNAKLDYSYPYNGPFHIASPELHPLYHYDSFIGGIFLMTKQHFSLVNGMSNRYWGWGREDDELFVRLKKSGLLEGYLVDEKGEKKMKYHVRRPQNISKDDGPVFKHIHDKKVRPRDNKRYFNQKEKTSRLDRETGADSVKYLVESKHELVIGGAPVTMMLVKLTCDFGKTPWCLKKEDHYLLYNETKAMEGVDSKV